MDVSIGTATGLIGLTAFTVSLIWLGLNSVKNIPIEIPARLLFFSLIICIVGYLLTPTGTANLRLIGSYIFK
ncbi:MAG: hypothetical protein KGZ56_02795 [Dethiobacter sp.]|jgi:hypothetical protein|nr:hypothetical protein [Dethiobacter sp.]